MTLISRRAMLAFALVGALPLAAAAQAPSASESNLVNLINQSPAVVSNYLDLAKLYYEQGRYADALGVTSRAVTLLQQRAQATQTTSGGLAQSTPGTAPAPPSPMAPVRVGGDIKEPKKIKDVKPVYPADAMAAGVQGIIIIEATIARDGTVKEGKVLRSVPGLEQAAVDAVRQWEFMPTLLNGAPVEVIMTVTVNFTLR